MFYIKLWISKFFSRHIAVPTSPYHASLVATPLTDVCALLLAVELRQKSKMFCVPVFLLSGINRRQRGLFI